MNRFQVVEIRPISECTGYGVRDLRHDLMSEVFLFSLMGFHQAHTAAKDYAARHNAKIGRKIEVGKRLAARHQAYPTKAEVKGVASNQSY